MSATAPTPLIFWSVRFRWLTKAPPLNTPALSVPAERCGRSPLPSRCLSSGGNMNTQADSADAAFAARSRAANSSTSQRSTRPAASRKLARAIVAGALLLLPSLVVLPRPARAQNDCPVTPPPECPGILALILYGNRQLACEQIGSNA